MKNEKLTMDNFLKVSLSVVALLLVSCSVYDNYSEDSYNTFWGIAENDDSQSSSGEQLKSSDSQEDDETLYSSVAENVPVSSTSVNPESSGSGTASQSSNSESAVVGGSSSSSNSGSSAPLAGECPVKLNDSRDGKSYYLIKIGNQCWFAENLKYESRWAKCYDGKTENCDLYGKLYKYADVANACPQGTRVPTKDDWESLDSYVHASNAGYLLKSAEYWESRGGNDTYGFSAYPAGKISDSGSSVNLLNWTGFWSSTDYDGDDEMAWYVYLNSAGAEFNKGGLEKENYISIRCLVE